MNTDIRIRLVTVCKLCPVFLFQKFIRLPQHHDPKAFFLQFLPYKTGNFKINILFHYLFAVSKTSAVHSPVTGVNSYKRRQKLFLPQLPVLFRNPKQLPGLAFCLHGLRRQLPQPFLRPFCRQKDHSHEN